MRNISLHVVALMVGVALLPGCSLLRPTMDTGKLTPQTTNSTLVVADLPFISPAEAGSWQVVMPAQLNQPAAASTTLATLGFTGLPPLLARMLANNPTLAGAQARLKLAEANVGIATGGMLPALNGNASAVRERAAPAFQGQGNKNLPTENRSSLGATLNWPLDIFGRIGNQVTAAKRLQDSSDAEVQATKLTLQAAVAQTYVQLLAAHQQVTIWQQALAAAEEQNRLTQLRYAAGDIAITQAQPVFASLQGLRVQALAAAQTEQQLHNALATLLGEAPQVFVLPATDLAQLQIMPTAAPTAIASQALLQRPDVRAAANQMAATNASIGVARAAFLPSLSITGNAGYSAGANGNLLDWNNRSWSVGPVLTLPLFQGTALRANLKRSWAQYEQAVAVYRGQVLTAYQQVADGLNAAQVSQAQAQSAAAAAKALGSAAQKMQLRYKVGDIAKTDWLTMQLNALQAQGEALRANAAQHVAAIELARALGGGY